MRRLTLTAFGLALTAALAPPALAAEDVAALAGRLATLRSEVEELAAEIDAEKDEERVKLRSLSEQRAEIEIELRRAGLRAAQLAESDARQKREIGDERALDGTLRPEVPAAIDALREVIRRGLPFRVAERIAELDKLESQVRGRLVRSQDAAYRLWQTYEDELRLTRESGLYRQPILLGGREILVDVARVGMVALFFRTNDGRVGRAVQTDGAWHYETIEDREPRRQIDTLFDAFKKQIRVGFFELPASLPAARADDAETTR